MCGIESRERRGQGWSQSCRPRPVLVIARLDTDDIQAHIYENRQRENNAFLIMLIQLLANDAVQLIGKSTTPPPFFCMCLVVVAGQLQSSPNTFQQHLTELMCEKEKGTKTNGSVPPCRLRRQNKDRLEPGDHKQTRRPVGRVVSLLNEAVD